LPEQLSLLEGATSAFGLVGDSPEIHRVLRIIQKLKNNRSPVLLLGESGTGKELVARALHEVSPGVRGVFVAVNCAALAPTLAESELFGHTRGSFTGATEARQGLLEQAQGGTLFLDEIGELSLEIQAKLLRALETREVRPVGAARLVSVDFRLLAATNRDLLAEAEREAFRADLFYRLSVIHVVLPPLRGRRGDIPLLVRHFVDKHARSPLRVSPEALDSLIRYDWPGNVRQLENCLLRMLALASSEELGVADLPTQLRNALESAEGLPPRAVAAAPVVAPLCDVERQAIEHAMKATGGDRRKAAQLLGIGRTTLYRKLKVYGRGLARSAKV
jgi:DNA-binding NtrC family response regulator